ncbi:Aldehyde/histidinol dehydrogenase [Boeremia exigua]|uniref:Aldehyde/histidinol dehydrogenase n=1 Tax=Boeremia exigua TaxID=749465 RepID=UPI001E8EA918|nr:Aldehyde/histidinol dehydrogenase [Boeremia exigua]KAH6618435.1 Aldehyde/histidinol dehydrogenase [Boeremia exigua]
MSAQEIVERLDIAWIEGRLENVLERQKQLAALHQSIRQRFDDFVRALEQDLHNTPELATSELITALDAINTLYEQLDFQHVLNDERKIKKGGTTAGFFVPLGKTLIVQLSFSPIISIIGPLAAALAAGSPTIVLGSPSLPATGILLERTILETLDCEAFHFEKSANESTYRSFAQAEYATVVLHSLETSNTVSPLVHAANPSIRLLEPYYGVPAGIIDRSVTISIDEVVKRVLQAVPDRPSGNHLRVPRLFFVDESIFASVKGKLPVQHDWKNDNLTEWLQRHYSGLSLSHSKIQGQKGQSPIFSTVEKAVTVSLSDNSEIILVSTRSLDHTIDLLNKINTGTGSQVIYIFAGDKEAFYLGNFITASHVYINDIPNRSLVLTSCRSANSSITHGYHLKDFSESKAMLRKTTSSSQGHRTKPAKLNTKIVKQPQGGQCGYTDEATSSHMNNVSTFVEIMNAELYMIL